MFKKRDLILIGSLAGLALAAFIIVALVNSDRPSYIEVTVNSTVTATYPIDTDGEYEVTGHDGTGCVSFTVRDGTVDVTEADCPNHICVDHRPVSRKGESIVCLPNRVIIAIR